ncbi:hypothetical protein SK128_019532, partial [Halocaridina rubra]
YATSSCKSFDRTSVGRKGSLNSKQGTNFFEKVCLRGVDYNRLCGVERLWAFERVLDAFLDGFDNDTIPNVDSRVECMRLCLIKTEFVCRSAEYDSIQRICRLSPEDRRTRPTNFRTSPGANVDYLENQCARTLPDCRYDVQNDVMIISMDALEFAATQDDCESLCDKTRYMTCRSYTYDPAAKRCYLSGDDSVSLNKTVLPIKANVVTGEKMCTVSQCEREAGTIIYEKITGRVVRSAREEMLTLDGSASNLGFTEKCARRCMDDSANCPAFAIDYASSRCLKLDRNTQGRKNDIVESIGKSYFEKVCVRGTIPANCRENIWHFERVPGMMLRGLDDRLYQEVQNRRDCIERCLAEVGFPCRSAEYDDSNLSCRLSRSDRRTSPNEFIQAQPANVEYLENQCPQGKENLTFV